MKPVIIAFLMFFVAQAYANEILLNDAECTKIFVKTQNASGKLDSKQVDEFLRSLDCGYFSSAEGGEFGNELIFMVLEQRPADFISSFAKLNKIHQGKIIGEIKNPVNDGFDLKKIYHGISETSINNDEKNQILKALK